jgi:Glyoxalase-like domain
MSRPYRWAILATLAMASDPKAAIPAEGPTVTLDHVIVAVSDLDRGIAELTRRTGIAPVIGGRHPGRGTRNALLSLGPRTYLELLAPGDDATEETRRLLGPYSEPTPIGWAIGTSDLPQSIAELRHRHIEVEGPADGSRVRPDGALLKWRTAQLGALPGAWKPFLIQWSADSPHPATTAPGGCRLESLTVTDPSPERTQDVVQALGLSLQVARGAPAGIRLVLACPAGQVELGRKGPSTGR